MEDPVKREIERAIRIGLALGFFVGAMFGLWVGSHWMGS